MILLPFKAYDIRAAKARSENCQLTFQKMFEPKFSSRNFMIYNRNTKFSNLILRLD